ncbi:MAG TPA: SusD/RagB family nutrient-binding outer membrane lipoprotein [Chitinophagaceae bacterium]|nr:SusD/RagB family nutrient-binding outer membrane lipoprotein [Chitinophagaceae bacterium]
MIRNKFKIVAASGLAALVLAVSSCSKIDQFGDMNQNPGNTTTPIPSGLLTNTLSGLPNYTWDAGGITTIAGLYGQYFSETQYTDVSTYSKQNPNWDGYYAGRLYDLQTIINYNSDPNTAATAAAYGSNANQIAVARILKAYIYAMLTDSYGDLPYSGALKGDNGIVAYDKQQDIYNSLFQELTEAVAQFDGGAGPKGDILFGGDVSMWKKFANSFHALLALHLSKVDAAKGQAEFNAALNAPGGVLQAGENISLAAPGDNFFNPVYNYYNITLRKDYAVSATLLNLLQSTNDDRATAYASSSIGFPYGLSRDNAIAFNNANPNWARLLQGQGTSKTAPFPIITSAEVFLARAEAAQLGWTGENVATLYATGISESWKYWNVFNQADYDNYMANPSIDLSGGSVLQKIATQEWISSYPHGLRAWTIWRRTGFPVLAPAPGAVTAQIPRRFAYGLNEYSLNPTNVAAAASQYDVGGDKDSQYGHVWWDK